MLKTPAKYLRGWNFPGHCSATRLGSRPKISMLEMSVHLRLLPFYKEATAFLLYECNIVKLVRRSHVFPKKNLAPLPFVFHNLLGQNRLSFYAAKMHFGQERHWFWPISFTPTSNCACPPSCLFVILSLREF